MDYAQLFLTWQFFRLYNVCCFIVFFGFSRFSCHLRVICLSISCHLARQIKAKQAQICPKNTQYFSNYYLIFSLFHTIFCLPEDKTIRVIYFSENHLTVKTKLYSWAKCLVSNYGSVPVPVYALTVPVLIRSQKL